LANSRRLLDLGLNFQVNYTGEVLGNLTSGIKRRAIYDNLLELAIDGDLKTIAGLRGASFHINSYQVNGVGLSGCCVFNVLTPAALKRGPTHGFSRLGSNRSFLATWRRFVLAIGSKYRVCN
jgi:porin